MNVFTERDVEVLKEKLNVVRELTDIDWEMREDCIIIKDLVDEVITLTSAKSARAFLDAYCLGYQHGQDDAQEDIDAHVQTDGIAVQRRG